MMGENPLSIRQQSLGNRGYTNKVRLPCGKGFAQRGLLQFLKPAKAGFVCVAAVSNRQALFNCQIPGDWKEAVGELMGGDTKHPYAGGRGIRLRGQPDGF